MPKEQEDQILTFVLTIVSVKMKVKFPCKMALEQAGRPLTTEVPPSSDNKFIFEQEVRLRQESQRMCIELNICLVTQKGARYISGIAKIYHNQLIRSEGDRLVVTLSKCLDTEAFCQLRVDKVHREPGPRKRTLTTLPEKAQRIMSPRHQEEANRGVADFRSPKKGEFYHMPYDTRSQSHFPVTANLKPTKLQEQLRGRDPSGMTGMPQSYRRGNLSPKNKMRQMTSKGKYLPTEFFHSDYERQKAMEGEVYRQNYQKLKQRYLKQAETSKSQMNKRMILENNQNNYKLEIVKLKIKNQQLDKAVNEKNARLKEMSISLASLQSRQSQIKILKEDLINKEQAIHIMDDTIVSLSRENDELRNNAKDISYQLEQKIIMLQNELELVTSKGNSKREELERQLKGHRDMLEHKEHELSKKNDIIEKQKRTVNELERTLQNKLFQFDSHLQNQKTSCKQKLDEYRHKMQELNQQLTKANSEKVQLSSEIDKYKNLVLKNQYEFKLFQQEMNTLRTELEQLRPFRDKNNDILKELRLINQQKIMIQKNHEKYVSSKEKGLEELTNEYRRQTEYLKKTVKELEDKSKGLSSKLMETETLLDITKASLQKSKKTNDSLTRELNQSRQKQKNQRKSLKKYEEETDDLRKDLSRYKQKTQALLQATKQELSKNKEELSKLRIDLQSEIVRNEQLLETNSELNMQLARMKMTQQFTDQKYEKLAQSSQDKYHQFQKIIKEHESVIELLEEKIRTQKEQQKNYYGKLQKCDYQITMVVDKNDKIVKEIKTLEEKNRQLQTNLKGKQMELVQSIKKISQTQSKVYLAQDKAKQLKDQLQLSANQLEKTKKILEIVQQDHEKTKQDMLNYCQKLNQAQKQLEDRHHQVKRNRQSIADLETKLGSSKKEYDKFRQSVTEALNSSFSQMTHNISVDRIQTVKNSIFNSEVQNANFKRGLADLSHDLVGVISSAGKQSKYQLTKLTERIRVLQRDIDILRNQMQRSQQISKRQLIEKSNMIDHLQENLRMLKDEKGQTQVQSQVLIQKLHVELKHSQSECQELESTKNQLQFALKGLKMQLQRLGEQFQTRLYQLMKDNRQMEDKLQFQNNKTEHAEKISHELEIEMMNINSVLIMQKQESYKKDIRISELQSQNQSALHTVNSLKNKLKTLEQQYNQLEIQHLTTCQIKQKYQMMLSEEQNKLKDVRSFNNNILKEKEQIIRKELQKNMEITTLESSVADLRHELQMMEQSRNKYKADLEDVKEQARRQNGQFKDLEQDLIAEVRKYNQIRDKLREKELQLTETTQELNLLRKKNEEQQARSKGMSEEFKQQNDMLSRQLEAINAQATQNIRSLESQLARTTKELQVCKQQLAQLQEAIFVERENNGSMNESIHKLKLELEEVRRKLDEMEKSYEELSEENRQKEEQMFELGGKLYEYENRMREVEEEHQRQMDQINTSFNIKYDEDYQEIMQKIELIEKERDYFKQKLSEKQEQVHKKIEDLKHREIQELQLKKMFEEKIKRIEQDKLSLFSEKNKELTKIMEENKSQFENLRQKDNELRKVVHELEISRNTIQKVQQKVKQMQADKTTQIKAYQQEIQNLRKKELTLKSYKDTIKSNQWNCEREVRKQIQNFIKKILEGGDKNSRSENLISSIKGMEEGMLTIIASVGKDGQ